MEVVKGLITHFGHGIMIEIATIEWILDDIIRTAAVLIPATIHWIGKLTVVGMERGGGGCGNGVEVVVEVIIAMILLGAFKFVIITFDIQCAKVHAEVFHIAVRGGVGLEW